jgi:hypothetical protein
MQANLPLRLVVLVAAVENAISGDAFRPGDILASRKGLTIEIGNTDAEGRLILADILTRAGEHAPDLTLDFATLTGAARVALGPELPPLYTDDEGLAADLLLFDPATVGRGPKRRVFDLPGGLGSIEFTSLRRFIGVEIRHDPTQLGVAVSTFFVVAGLLASLGTRRRRVWIRVGGTARTPELEWGGMSRGDDPRLDVSLDRLVGKTLPPSAAKIRGK